MPCLRDPLTYEVHWVRALPHEHPKRDTAFHFGRGLEREKALAVGMKPLPLLTRIPSLQVPKTITDG
jgi:hypothetical protein